MKNYPLNTCDRYESFAAFVDKIARDYNDNAAISSYSVQGVLQTKTYNQLAADVYAIAEVLFSRGLSAKNIAIISPNSYMAIVATLACTYGGGVAIPLDIEQTPETLKSMAFFADAELIFISEDMIERVGGLELFEGKPTIVLSDNPLYEGGFYEMLDKGNSMIAAAGRKCLNMPINPTQTALIVYTSGTTSTSKPVMLSQRALLNNASGSMQLVKFPSRMFTSLPLYHTYAFTCSLLNSLMKGCEVCINGDLRFMLRDLTTFRPSGMVVVPLIAEVLCKKLVDIAGLDGGDFASFIKKATKGVVKQDPKLVAIKEKVVPGLSLMICGGAHLSTDIAKLLFKFGVSVLEGYGITECSPLISVNRNDFYEIGSVGVLVPELELKFEDGEILVRGPSVMNGYYKQPEMTAEVIENGWFRTGDLGSIDDEGFLYITGRKKNLIVLKNGKKVSPEELEDLLTGIPLAKELMVYGSAVGNVTDDVVPAVSIYPDPDATKGMSSYEILSKLQAAIDAVNENLSHYKQIRLINIREKELPKTSTKKIKRC